jgi:hypothetical protein
MPVRPKVLREELARAVTQKTLKLRQLLVLLQNLSL